MQNICLVSGQHKMKFQLISIVVFVLLGFCHGIYFVLEEGQNRCFLEEVPKDTLVLGKYRTEEWTAVGVPSPTATKQKSAIKVTVTDPEGNLFLQRDMNSEGRFAFTSQIGGEHKICFQTNTSRWFGAKQKLKFHLDMEKGESATDYEEIAKQEHLSAIEVSVRKLIDRVRDIRSEQDYQRKREATFRNTSESTNGRVTWWSVIQTLILVSTGLWQITHLKNFFKAKKLV